MCSSNLSDDEISRFVFGSSWNLQQSWVVPQGPGLNEIDAVLGPVSGAFLRVELKPHYGIEIIPILNPAQASIDF